MPTYSEEELEDHLVENLNDVFGEEWSLLGRQIYLGTKRADVVLVCRRDGRAGHYVHVLIVEVKKNKARVAAVHQLLEYTALFRTISGCVLEVHGDTEQIVVGGAMAAPSISAEAGIFCREMNISFVKLVPTLTVQTDRWESYMITSEQRRELTAGRDELVEGIKTAAGIEGGDPIEDSQSGFVVDMNRLVADFIGEDGDEPDEACG